MKFIQSLMLLTAPAAMLSPSNAMAQALEAKDVNPYRAAPVEAPKAVAKARVMAETTTRNSKTGATMTVQVIAPPLLTADPAPLPVAESKVPPSAEAWAARRTAEPTVLKLFSPKVMVYPGGISLVKWWNPDLTSPARELEAWVATGLESIWACGDLTVGNCRYLLMPTMFHATDRLMGERKAPALADFKGEDNILLVKGDPKDAAALEPLIALLDKYDTEGGLIDSTFAAQQAQQKEQAEWEAGHPEPSPQMTVKFWPVQSTQYSTTPGK